MKTNRIFIIALLLLNIKILTAQTVDLTSVDEFFKITSTLKQGKEISNEQWERFDKSSSYKLFSESENKFLINTIKTSIAMVFANDNEIMKDSILNISKEEMAKQKNLMLKKLILTNYQDIKNNYDSIQSFREHYDLASLPAKAIQRLQTFLGTSIDSTMKLKPIFFFFLNQDGSDSEDALFIDFNLIYKMTEQERIDFLAHEYFHNYRGYFEKADFNHKCDLSFMLDMIQNEGIADQIDKSMGYQNYYSSVRFGDELSQIMVDLYNNAEEDLKKIQNIIIQYTRNEITQSKMVDELLEVYKFNGHAIGFYMSNQIIKAGYKKKMVETFYNPYEFYRLYNLAAIKNHSLQLNDEFMTFLRRETVMYQSKTK